MSNQFKVGDSVELVSPFTDKTVFVITFISDDSCYIIPKSFKHAFQVLGPIHYELLKLETPHQKGHSKSVFDD